MNSAAMVYIRSWFRRNLSDPQVVTLVLIILVLAGTIAFFGEMLLPLLAGVVIAYLLEGLVRCGIRQGGQQEEDGRRHDRTTRGRGERAPG